MVDVTDPSGANVPNAQVHVEDLLTTAKAVRNTDASGRVVIELQAGKYLISVKHPGFRLFTQQIEARLGESSRISLVLQLGGCEGPCVTVTSIPLSEMIPQSSEENSLSISNMRVLVRQDKNGSYVEVHEFQETQGLRLLPSDRFDVVCQIVGDRSLPPGDFLLWTTADFIVAPVTRSYEQMDSNQLGASVGWGQVTEMRDLQVVPIYFLRAGESRDVVVKELDLRKVLQAFPAGSADNLWPWLIRVTAHVQDRSGKEAAVAERVLRLSPSSVRRNDHYNDPLPSR